MTTNYKAKATAYLTKTGFVKDIFAQKLTKNNFYHWREYHLC